MKKRMIVILGTALLVLAAAGTSLAAETTPASNQPNAPAGANSAAVLAIEPVPPEIKTFTLAQAIKTALADNRQVELAALDVEKAQLTLDQALFAQKKTRDNLSNNNSSPDQDAVMATDVVPVQAQAVKAIADTAREYTLSSIKFDVESAYYAVLRAEKILQTAENSYKRTDVQYLQVQAKIKAGVSAKLDMISAEAQRKSAAADVNSAKASLAINRMAFNQTLGLPLDTLLTLTDKFDFQMSEIPDIAQVIATQDSRDLSYVTAKETLHSQQVGYAYYEDYYTPNTFLYRDAAYQLKQAEVSYDKAKATLELNVKTAALTLETAGENYNTLTKSLAQALEAYRLTKLRFDVGMATNYEVLSAEEALNQVELGLTNALFNFNLAKAQFSNGTFGSASTTVASSGS